MRKSAFTFCFLAWSGACLAQSLLEDYERVVTVVEYSQVYVGETLLACASQGVLTEAQAEERFKAYRERNAAVVQRAEAWKARAEKRLDERGEAQAARERAGEAGMSAVAGASMHAQREVNSASDPRALCAGRFAAIDAGRFDLSRNAPFVDLLKD